MRWPRSRTLIRRNPGRSCLQRQPASASSTRQPTTRHLEERPMGHKTANDGRLIVYLAAVVSALGGMLFGYDIGVISGAILFIKNEFRLSSGLEEIVVSSVLLGSLGGAVLGGSLADRLGRRRLLVGTAIVFGLGAVGAAVAPDTAWLIGARVVAGAAIG